MSFTTKVWKDDESGETPISAAALIDLEKRLAGYSDAAAAAVAGAVETDLGLLVPKSVFDAKGDLLLGTADNAFDNLSVGADHKVLVADSSLAMGARWGADDSILERTFLATGEVTAKTLAGFFVGLATSEKKTLVGMCLHLSEGTSVKVTIKKNGSVVTGFNEITAKSAEDVFVEGKAISLANKDRLAPTLSSPTGAPKELAITLFIERTR